MTAKGAVQVLEVLELDNVLGTKRQRLCPILRVLPPSYEGYRLLLQYAEEAAILAQSSTVVLCGDLNLHISDDDDDLAAIKEVSFRDALGPAFIRAYLGDATTRPAYRADAFDLVGKILDHFFVAGADAADGAVLVYLA